MVYIAGKAGERCDKLAVLAIGGLQEAGAG
jgi:hypothetical protein